MQHRKIGSGLGIDEAIVSPYMYDSITYYYHCPYAMTSATASAYKLDLQDVHLYHNYLN